MGDVLINNSSLLLIYMEIGYDIMNIINVNTSTKEDRKRKKMYKDYNDKIPKEAIQIMQMIEAAGYEAYIVGGCVRDLLMNRQPHDWDITTSAKPEEIKRIFKRTYDTGIEHGTVTVILNTEHFEVTTYRIEGEYKDFRRPDKVSFVDDITLDLSRRDFTMNAIAYHPDRGFVDPYEGQRDIKRQCIRSVRCAKERFTEDALRILRAVRFSAQLGFQIETETLKGIEACRALLTHISKERIRDEFLKICVSSRPGHIDLLYQLKLLEYIFPDFIKAYEIPQNHPHHTYNVAKHTLVAMENSEPTVIVRLTMLLHDIGKVYTRTTDKHGIDHFYNHPKRSEQIASEILKDLRMDNHTIKAVCELIRYHDYHIEHHISKVYVKKVMMVIGEELFDELLKVQYADAMAQNLEKLQPKLDAIEKQRNYKNEVIANHEPYHKGMLAITGSDLIEIGIPKGKIIGDLLEVALQKVIHEPNFNQKALLLTYCMEHYKVKGKQV